MHIGEVADATGLSRDTLRFYEKQGLLRTRRTANGYRDYPPQALDLLRYIQTAQALGFTLNEIKDGLSFSDDPLSGPQIQLALAAKLSAIDERIAALQTLRTELELRLGPAMAACPLASTPAQS
ncbi:MAG TPA: MerR family transcriptional regulator [Burkholderiaceae bacterium]